MHSEIKIKILPLEKVHLPGVRKLIEITIPQTFIDNGVFEKNSPKALQNEIERIVKKIKSIFNSNKSDKAFVAIDIHGKVVGIIAALLINNSQKDALLKSKIKNWEDIVEISMCYVLPEYQKKGIGKKLLIYCLNYISNLPQSKYFLYSGYPISIKVWRKLLGREVTIIPKYFPDKQDCYVWYGDIAEVQKRLARFVLEHTPYMELALMEADIAVQEGNAPFGVVVVDPKGNIVWKDHDRVKERMDPTAHGEINAIRALCKKFKTLSLEGFSFYTTSEPCPTCISAMIKAKVSYSYFGCKTEPTASLPISASKLAQYSKNHSIKVTGGILERECLTQRSKYRK
jgi:tRNA(Arg) A34 adenosine deaminase TadA/ribosomal protein S18 acetylase RimI-like enzyme